MKLGGALAIACAAAAAGCGAVFPQRAVLSEPVDIAPARAIEPGKTAGMSRFVVRPPGSSVQVYAVDGATGDYTLTFHAFGGSIVVDPSGKEGRLKLDVELAQVTTRTESTTDIIKYELLEVSPHPQSKLIATIKPTDDPDERVIEGNMQLHGVVRGIRIKGTLKREGDGWRFKSAFNLSRHAFGMYRNPDLDWMIHDDFRVMLDLLAKPERVTIETVEEP
jgi:polyisoprenoid-binding protein YceI